ncbi:MAG TPA: extensin family protein, partial [Beijerinckiaceae bacterium]|nr:extensin family protein [Beijerinckiaceae bacterium]
FANAIDISGFDFGRKNVQIGDHPAETAPALFQAAIRSQACAYFTTVLGPGSDAAHATHLHLDLRGRKGNHRICQ